MNQLQGITAIDILAIILSVVSLIITIVGFFASLRFYRDGMNLQEKANNALTKLEEKTQFIQAQVGGMFDKTLDAAIGRKEALSENFEELNEQLEKTKFKIIEEAINQVGAAGEQERKRLATVVDNQMDIIRKKVEITREYAEDITQEVPQGLTPSLLKILRVLASEEEGLSTKELAERTGMPETSAGWRIYELNKRGAIGKRNGKHYVLPSVKDRFR